MNHRKRLFTMGLWTLLLLSVAVAVGRLLWVAGQTEVGGEILAIEWRDATLGLIVGRRPVLSGLPRVKRAEFWLREVDRITNEHPEDAELAAGAALLLNAEAVISFYQTRWAGVVDGDIAVRCRAASKQLALRATELDPDNPVWWRLTASLHAEDIAALKTDELRNKLLERLNAWSQHDPNNALYLYLAAMILWEDSYNYVMSDDATHYGLYVDSPVRFKEATRKFERALEKPFLRGLDEEARLLAKLAHAAELSPYDRVAMVDSHRYLGHATEIHAWRIHVGRAEESRFQDDFARARRMHQQMVRATEQLECPNSPSFRANMHCESLRLNAIFYIEADEAMEEEREQAIRDAIAGKVRQQLVYQAENALQARRYGEYIGSRWDLLSRGSTSHAVRGLAARPLPRLIVILGLAGGLLGFASPRDKTTAMPPIGLAWHLVILGTVLAMTVTLFALAPAHIVPVETQNLAFTGLILGGPLLLLVLIGWYWVHGRQYQFSLRFLFTMMLLASAILGLLVIGAGVNAATFSSSLPFQIDMQLLPWHDIEDTELKRIGLRAPLHLAAIQLDAYYGAYLTIIVWAFAITSLLNLRIRRHLLANPDQHLSRRKQWGCLVDSFQKPAVALALFLLLAYALLMPQVLQSDNQRYQGRMRMAAEVNEYGRLVEAEVERLAKTPGVVNTHRAAAKAELGVTP